jgi:hypothetical protein
MPSLTTGATASGNPSGRKGGVSSSSPMISANK